MPAHVYLEQVPLLVGELEKLAVLLQSLSLPLL